MSSAFAIEIGASVDWSEKRVVHFAVEGVVDEVNIQQGDSFEKGQTLLSLDKTVYTQKVALLKAKVAGLKPVFDDADRELEQAKTLYEQTVLSDVELQKVQVSYEIAKSNLAQAKSQYRIAQWELDNASFVAPWNGYISESHVMPGRFVSRENNEKPLLILIRSDRLKAVGWVTKSIADSIDKTGKASVEMNGKTHPGEIIDVRRNMANTSKGNYRLTVEFNSESNLPVAVGQAAVIKLP